MIVMWHGLIEIFLFGWALCDGNNGTPNLTDRFVIGHLPLIMEVLLKQM